MPVDSRYILLIDQLAGAIDGRGNLTRLLQNQR